VVHGDVLLQPEEDVHHGREKQIAHLADFDPPIRKMMRMLCLEHSKI
jgi:hypothetical protein